MFVVFPKLRLRISVFALPAMLLMLWTEGTAAFLMLVFSALTHECGHIVALKLLGYRARRVDLLPMGALIVCPEGIPDRDEFVIALSGPLFSLVLSLVFTCLFFALGGVLLLFGAVINASLGTFNLLPVSKLDGGKALFCFLSYKGVKNASRICNIASAVSKSIFVAASVLCAMATDFNLGVILLLLALLFQL